ncbi:hypothetical protein G3T20_05275 [Bordetella hinzii]|uniref:hypothetical protein n=1 Tax=Bordetella hinzii TaxID=103855 RepID=UPI0013EFFB4A|nr:hypothetical protein [Bordetella hinzii]QII84163.1 hypothetical protein G3T20_05275 [Bordetella hinzii]
MTALLALVSPLWAKVKAWVGVALAVGAAIGGAFLLGRTKGAAAQAQKDAANDAQANAAAYQHAADAVQERNNVEADINRQPDGSAADRLRDRWARD